MACGLRWRGGQSVRVETDGLAHDGVQQQHQCVVLASDLRLMPHFHLHLAPRQRQQCLQLVLFSRVALAHASPRVVDAFVVRGHVVQTALVRRGQQQPVALAQHVNLPRAHPLGFDGLREGIQRQCVVRQQSVAQRRLFQRQRLRVMMGARRDGREGLLPLRERGAVLGELLLE